MALGAVGVTGMGWVLMISSMLLWAALLVAIGITAYRWLKQRPVAQQRVPALPPLEILRQRLERGEIDAPTFVRMRAELENELRRH